MTITAAPPEAPPRGEDRTPPQDVAAEQCVLGAMLQSKDAIADVVEVLRVSDFYLPAHATIFDAVLDLYGRGEPADPITVIAKLIDDGTLMRPVGGADYVHTCVSAVPTAANGGYYARIVADRAVMRRLIEAGTKVVQLGYGGAGDVDQLVDRAQQAVYDVTERRSGDDLTALADMLQPTLDEIEAIGNSTGLLRGIPTGFTDLDRLLNGLQPGQLVVVAGRPGLGKALALDTPLATPDGWTTMGEVRVGDRLLGADGRATTVTATSDVMLGRACYEVEFDDGSVITADADHLWKTTTRASRRQRGETKRTHQWPADMRRIVAAAHDAAMQSQDVLVTFGEAVDLVGERFRSVLHVVGQGLGVAGHVEREYRREGKPWRRTIQAYSKQRLLAALRDRTSRIMNVENTARHPAVVTTAQIAATLRYPTDNRLNHAVDNGAPLHLPPRDLLIPPYTLGAWLGDGHSAAARLTSADSEIPMRIEADGYETTAGSRLTYRLALPPPPPLQERRCTVCGATFTPRTVVARTCGRRCGGAASRPGDGDSATAPCYTCGTPIRADTGARQCMACYRGVGSLTGRLRMLGVLSNKHIPTDYLRASEPQRRALLAGLMDTDGTVAPNGNLQYCTTSAKLADDVHELIVGLGYHCYVNTKPVKGRTPASSTAYTLGFSTADEVFCLPRKQIAHKARYRAPTRTVSKERFMVDVRPVLSVPVRCVRVDNADNLFLAGRFLVPTHNSTAALDFTRACSIRHNLASAIFSLEMSKVEIVMRLLSAEARVPLHVLRSGHLSDDDWARIGRRMGEIAEAPLYIDDSPSMTLMEIRAKARRLRQRHDLKLIIVDYLQLMVNPRRVESREQEVADLSRGLKLLAKEVECPVVAVSQLNRGPEQRTDKRPQLSDLRSSGAIEQDADVVILLHRDDYYDKESPRTGEADFIVAKHRNGPTDTVTVAAQLHLARFVDMAIT